MPDDESVRAKLLERIEPALDDGRPPAELRALAETWA
jgi:hypothetical protein